MEARSPDNVERASANRDSSFQQNNTSLANGSDLDEVDAISTVALLIDDLSSEDPNAKMHSIQRLSQIANLLGPERCVEELIPMLSELIDKIDCNPELMMTLAEQLGGLTDHLGCTPAEKAEHCEHLLRPLEIIVGSDDSVVQGKAIASLKRVTAVLNSRVINGHYVELCGRLDEGDYYSMRIAACHLYAQIYGSLS